MTKPIVLLDLDGPCANFDLAYWDETWLLAWDAGNPFDIESLDEQRHRFLGDHVRDLQLQRRVRTAVNKPGWFAKLPVVDGCVEGVHRLIELGCDVWWCSKPLEANPTCRDEKADWLERHFWAGASKQLILAPDKSMVRGHVLVDDAIKAGWDALAVWEPVVFETPWNGEGTEYGRDRRHFAWGDEEAVAALAHQKAGWNG